MNAISWARTIATTCFISLASFGASSQTTAGSATAKYSPTQVQQLRAKIVAQTIQYRRAQKFGGVINQMIDESGGEGSGFGYRDFGNFGVINLDDVEIEDQSYWAEVVFARQLFGVPIIPIPPTIRDECQVQLNICEALATLVYDQSEDLCNRIGVDFIARPCANGVRMARNNFMNMCWMSYISCVYR